MEKELLEKADALLSAIMAYWNKPEAKALEATLPDDDAYFKAYTELNELVERLKAV